MTALVSLFVVIALLGVRSIGWTIFVRLPSTLLHELSHWAVALLTGSSPGMPSILPKKIGKGKWILGSVEFRPGTWTAAFVALAPAWLLGGLCVYGWLHADWAGPAQQLTAGVLLGFAAAGSVPSSQDWDIALQHPLSLGLLGLVLAAAWLLYGA